MPRLDISWGTGVQVREQAWQWRRDITCQVVNPDIDGLLTACLLHYLKGWPVIGFYDTRRLWLDPVAPVPLDLRRTIWVDVDMCWPGARSLSQHVVTDAPSDARSVSAYAETVNPSLLRDRHWCSRYQDKYPFGTFQWAWWLSGGAGLPPPPDPHDLLMTGLAWMPDGGFRSVRERWRENCLRWAIREMPGSILEPLALRNPDDAWDAVRAAERRIVELSGVRRGWRNHQFNLTHGSAEGPRLNYMIDEAPQVLQAICDAIAGTYGWSPPEIPPRFNEHRGVWRTGASPPVGWPEATDKHEVVSLAVTGAHRFCWTEPGALAEALPHH